MVNIKKTKLFQLLSQSRWNLAFVQDGIEKVITCESIQFTPVINPYRHQCWFADPFILDFNDDFIYLLAEEMRYKVPKGRIAKLTIERKKMTIVKVEIVLEEQWHLSFPNIIRQNGRIFVYPESANSGKLYLYELIDDENGCRLERISTLCDDVIWDSTISDLFGDKLMFTSRSNNFHLDIYQWEETDKRFHYSQTLDSTQPNMRMAGALFKWGNDVYCPSQISWNRYGEAVEMKKISQTDDGWNLETVRKLMPPKKMLINGMHTFNVYKDLIVVDTHQYSHIISKVIGDLALLKRKIKKRH